MLDYKISRETFRSDTKYLGFDELHFWSTEVLKVNVYYLQSELAIPEPGSHRKKKRKIVIFNIIQYAKTVREEKPAIQDFESS